MGVERVPWCRPGLELHLVESRLVAFDTGERFSTLSGLVEALPRSVAALALLPRTRRVSAQERQ